jgi:AmmeMemoRadiSam system protein B
MTQIIRPAAVAGSFYPDNPEHLRTQISDFLHEIHVGNILPKALIVPHAGYIYSGSIAASAYATLKNGRDSISRVVLIGPSHRVPFKGIATSQATHFSTPLGKIPLDVNAIRDVEKLSYVAPLDEAHSFEHSLEVQLPFLQETINNFSLIPLVVGDIQPEQLAELIGAIWGGAETVIIISSDLSHYHDYKSAQKMDLATAEAIASLSPSEISYDDACGQTGVNALLIIAKIKGLKVVQLDLRNSGDTAGSRDQVVGYGSWAFVNPDA